jgi:hypothetical protein
MFSVDTISRFTQISSAVSGLKNKEGTNEEKMREKEL